VTQSDMAMMFDVR